MKAVVAAFNQEKALVGAFSVITNLRMELFQALVVTLTKVRPHVSRLARCVKPGCCLYQGGGGLVVVSGAAVVVAGGGGGAAGGERESAWSGQQTRGTASLSSPHR